MILLVIYPTDKDLLSRIQQVCTGRLKCATCKQTQKKYQAVSFLRNTKIRIFFKPPTNISNKSSIVPKVIPIHLGLYPGYRLPMIKPGEV